jgi:hypothetical protein
MTTTPSTNGNPYPTCDRCGWRGPGVEPHDGRLRCATCRDLGSTRGETIAELMTRGVSLDDIMHQVLAPDR